MRLLLHAVIKREFPGAVGVAISARQNTLRLLEAIAEIDPDIPVLFAHTVPYTAEDIAARKLACAQLGLHNFHAAVSPEEPETLRDMLDRMGLLAIITEREGDDVPRIELDDDGVFHIHPLAGTIPTDDAAATSSEATADWSV